MDNMIGSEIENAKKRVSVPKIIFIIFGVILAGELLWAIRTFTQPTPTAVFKERPLSPAVASLTSAKNEYRVGEIAYVNIRIDAGGHKTSGSDAILHFDPKVLEATTSAITKGKIYSNFSALEVDQAQGLITISGINIDKTFFSGIGVLAAIDFKTKAPAQTKLTLEFNPNSTKDSNVVDSTTGKDVLAEVKNLDLTIK